MKVVVAIDSFKGSMTSMEAGLAARDGILAAKPDAEVIVSPLAHLAKEYGCRVIAFGGGVTEEARACNDEGIDAFFPTVRGITTLDEAMDTENAKKNMRFSVEQVFRLL